MKHQSNGVNATSHGRLDNIGDLSENPLATRLMSHAANNYEPNRPELTAIAVNDSTASTTASNKFPSEHFKYRGRGWRIFKRSADLEASWYLYFEFNKKRFGPMSLGSSSKQHCLAEAKLKIDLHYSTRDSALRDSMARPGVKTFSPLAAIIGKAGTDDFGVVLLVPTKKMAGARARKSYAWSLRWCLRLALDLTDAQVDALDAGVLNKETARKFFDAVARDSAAITEQAERNTFVRTAHSFFNNARALFAPRPLEAMRASHSLHLPDKAAITEFRDGQKTYGQSVPPSNKAVLPSDAIINHTLREWIRIAETPGYKIPGGNRLRIPGVLGHLLPLTPLNEIDRRNLFVAVGIELACGLRASETQRVRRNWITTHKGRPLLQDLDTKAKDGTGKIEVAPLDPFWRVLWFWIAKNNWDVGPTDFLLIAREPVGGLPGNIQRGGISDRQEWPEVHASRWLRGLGWQTQKTNHALRDFSASMITMRYGLGSACDWCRHKTQVTTERNYSRFVKMSRRVDARELAWIRWAK